MKKNKTEKLKKKSKKIKRLKKTFLLSFVKLSLKILLVFFVLLFICYLYFSQVINNRISQGKVWELPVAVYSKIVKLSPNQANTQQNIIATLNGSHYREVKTLLRPGDYVIDGSKLHIYRRAFDFPDGYENAKKIIITTNSNKISSIFTSDSLTRLNELKIDPELITFLSSNAHEPRLFVKLQNFPDSLTQILIATEDQEFYSHDGVNLKSIARAFYVNLTSKRIEGGSTLTQQLVKNLFLSSTRSYSRKLKELFLAIVLDNNYSKEKILELYLNEVYLGQNGDKSINGIPLASQTYFGRPVAELSLDQQAMLVGMLKGPSVYNPWNRPKEALIRRNTVLRIMTNKGIINETLFNELSKRPLEVLPKGQFTTMQPAFMQAVNLELDNLFSSSELQKLSGSKIFTSYNPAIQKSLENSITDSLPNLIKKSGDKKIQLAAVIVDKTTGDVRAMVGSNDPSFAGFNRAMNTRRSVGSVIKPAVYLSALRQPERYQLNTVLADQPLTINAGTRNAWSPQNYDRKFRDTVLLSDALTHSLNVPTVNLGLSVSLNSVNNTLADLGLPRSKLKNTPAILLGALDLTPLEVAQMYQTIANNGRYVKTSFIDYILSERSDLIYEHIPEPKTAIPEQADYLTLYAMQNVVKKGTAREIGLAYPNLNLAGKTGTTNDNKDSWFSGIDGQNVTVIWVGRDDNQNSRLTGSSGAMSIYKNYLKQTFIMPLELKQPIHIEMMGVNINGAWACGDIVDHYLPIWTNDFNSVCQDKNKNTFKDSDALENLMENLF